MTSDLTSQLRAYGEFYASELENVIVEELMVKRSGNGNVKTLEQAQPAKEPGEHRRGVLVAAAVFVAAIAIGAFGLLVANGSGTDAVEPTPTTDPVDSLAPPFLSAEQAAAAYAASFATTPWDQYKEIWTEAARNMSGESGYSPLALDEQQLVYRYKVLSGERLTLDSCIAKDGAEATCAFTMTSDAHEMLEAQPDRFRYRVLLDEQGRIDLLELQPGGSSYDPVWDEIDRWYLAIPGPWNRLDFLETDPETALAELYSLIDRFQNGEL